MARDSSAGMSFIRFPSPVSIFLPRLKKRATPAFQRGLCVCTYVGTFECGGVHMHMYGRGQRTTSVVIPQTPPSPLFLRQGLSLDWKHAQSAQLGSQKDPGIHSRAGSTSVHHGTWLVV